MAQSSRVRPLDCSNMKTAKGSWVKSDLKMEGKTVLITGANTGIGLETAVDLAKRGAKVIIACRSVSKGEAAINEINERTGSDKVTCKQLDLASFSSIRKLADDIKENEARLDILINNAGVMMCPQSETEDGFEMHFGVNHLGHFLLTNLLLVLIKASAPSRIITLSSVMHTPMYNAFIHWDDLNLKNSYNPRDGYSQSKLMNILFSRELGKKLAGTGVTTYSVHPGIVKTGLLKNVGTHSSCWDTMFYYVTKATWLFWKSPEHGAQTTIYCAIAPEIENITGKYYCDCQETNESAMAKDDEAAKKLWEISLELTKLNEIKK